MIVLFFTYSLLALITYQDYSVRGVSWWVLPLVFVSIFYLMYEKVGLDTALLNLGANSMIIILNIICVIIYYSIKNGKIEMVVDKYLGLGDILFLVCLAPIFSMVDFIFFLLITYFFSILVYGVFLFFKRKMSTIPLAGNLAIVMFLYLVLFSASIGQDSVFL